MRIRAYYSLTPQHLYSLLTFDPSSVLLYLCTQPNSSKIWKFQSDSDSDIIPADWYSESPERLVPILLNRNQEKPGNQQNSTTTKLKTNVKAKVKVERRVKVNKNLKDKRKKESLGEEKVASEENDLKVERAHRSGILFSDYLSELVVQDSSAAYPTIVFPEVLDDIYDFEIEKRVMQNQSKGWCKTNLKGDAKPI